MSGVRQAAEKTGSPNSEDAPKCRICFEEVIDTNDPLIRPCKCAGSIKLAHKFCLQKWRMQASNPLNMYKCLVCIQEYRTTTSSLRKLAYFYVFPGLESLFYSCCIAYLIGYFMSPGEEATRAEKAISSPPFTPNRALNPAHPPSRLKPSRAYKALFGYQLSIPIKREMISSSTRPTSSWRSYFKSNNHWRRFFTGQYTWSLVSYTSTEVGRAIAMDRWQIVLDISLFWWLPELVGYLFDHVIFEYAPALERPFQVLIAGKVFFDFARLTKRIYDFVLREYYKPHFWSELSEVKDLDEIS